MAGDKFALEVSELEVLDSALKLRYSPVIVNKFTKWSLLSVLVITMSALSVAAFTPASTTGVVIDVVSPALSLGVLQPASVQPGIRPLGVASWFEIISGNTTEIYGATKIQGLFPEEVKNLDQSDQSVRIQDSCTVYANIYDTLPAEVVMDATRRSELSIDIRKEKPVNHAGFADPVLGMDCNGDTKITSHEKGIFVGTGDNTYFVREWHGNKIFVVITLKNIQSLVTDMLHNQKIYNIGFTRGYIDDPDTGFVTSGSIETFPVEKTYALRSGEWLSIVGFVGVARSISIEKDGIHIKATGTADDIERSTPNSPESLMPSLLDVLYVNLRINLLYSALASCLALLLGLWAWWFRAA
jgi:hypothetical protein